MTGLTGAAAKRQAIRLGEANGCSWQHIYGMTAHLRQGTRKRRSDAGKRKYDIVPGTDTFEAASLVIGAKLDPDQALLTAKANGHNDLPTLATFQKMLREKEVNRKQLRSGRRNHRNFEAAAPLDIVQIDSSALKIRWVDFKTRRIKRIEGIDKNHPQLDPSLLRVWQVVAIDDHSRRRFVQFIATHHITSADMVRFFCDLCCAWGGVPKMVYTDNGPEFQRFFAQAVRVIQRMPAIVETGGFEHRTHAPGNAQASGKVEVAHQRVEKMNKFVGLAEQKGIDVTLEQLEEFSRSIDQHDNEVKVHRSTGQTPIARWFGTQTMNRTFPTEMIRAALLFTEAERKIASDMTIVVDKVKYLLPVKHPVTGELSGLRSGMKINVVVPHELDEIFITLPANGGEIAILKTEATVDVAGEFKTAAPSQGETITKALKEHHVQRNREAKDLKKQTGEVYQIPFVNHEIEVPASTSNVIGIGAFKHPEIAVTSEEIAAASPVPIDGTQAASLQGTSETSKTGSTSQTVYAGKPINFWEAIDEFKTRFTSITEAKDFLTREIFPGQQGTVPVTEVEAAIDNYFNPQQEVAKLRLAG